MADLSNQLYPNGFPMAAGMYIWNGSLWVKWDGAVTGTFSAVLTNDGTFAKETGGNLAIIAGKDFATQTTLALIKAKTDNIPALGQALAAASVPIVLTAAQLTTLTPPAAITGFATETTLGTRLSESDFDTKTGSLTETAPATDTASSGLNGRLQRIAQRLTSLIAAIGSPFQAGGSIGNTTFASTVADGANVTLGTTTDTAVITDATGTIHAYLRGLIKLAITSGSWLSNITQWGSNAVTGGSGAVAAGTPRVTLASDDPAVATLGATSGAKVITDANGTIQQYLRGLIYQLITLGASFFTPTPATTGGWTYSLKNALTNTNSQVKSGQGTLGGYYIYNPNSSVAYVQIFDTATGSITVGTTTPKLSIGIPATSAANLDSTCGIQFGTAICVAATTTATGGTAPSTALDCNFWYK